MKWYCEKCKKIHDDNELCPHIKSQLKQHPEWLTEAANFTTVAGEDTLVSSQALDRVARGINNLTGSELSYEGTQQYARDIQVFKRINDEYFTKMKIFDDPQLAKEYYISAQSDPGKMNGFMSNVTGYSQEIDWLREKQGQLSSIYEKSELLDNHAPGIDGITVNRFNGKVINRTTVKASTNHMTPSSKGVIDVKKAINNNTASSKDILYAPKGTTEAARKAGLSNPVVEKNSTDQIRESNDRLSSKILSGNAVTSPTLQQVGQKMAQGAIVGAAVSVTVSAITTYVRYKNGELTQEEAFSNVAEDTTKGLLVGGALGAVTIFLPCGVIGFIAGVAIGIYFDKVCTNILDEIYGKGAFGAILNSSGYVYGMTLNLADYYEKINRNNKIAENNIARARATQREIDNNFDLFEKMKGE